MIHCENPFDNLVRQIRHFVPTFASPHITVTLRMKYLLRRWPKRDFGVQPMLTPGPRLASAAARILRSMRQPDMFEERGSRTRPRHLSEGFEQIIASPEILESGFAPTGRCRRQIEFNTIPYSKISKRILVRGQLLPQYSSPCVTPQF